MSRAVWQTVVAALVLHTVLHGRQIAPFKSETRLVVLHATVRNGDGEAVTTLPQSAFTVFENGKRQPIVLFRRDDTPVSLGLLIDNSGSMRSLRTRVEAAALAFVRASNSLDEACVINFADTVRLDVPFTSDGRALEAGIARTDSIGGTAMRDAISLAERYAADHATRERKVLLVVTDGIDNASVATAADIVGRAERQDLMIYAIGLFGETDPSRRKHGEHELDVLTQHSGGVAYYPTTVNQINDVAVDIARQVRNQYTIGYAPLNTTLDGSYRTIRLTAKDRERLTVQTRAGYWATAATSVPKSSH